MKKLIALFLLSPLAFADMDYVCDIKIDRSNPSVEQQIKDQSCERDNILNIYFDNTIDMKIGSIKAGFTADSVIISLVSSQWCRFDRNTNITYNNYGAPTSLSCVLYSDEPRKIKP
jgi:hypothetical protein